MQETTRRPWLPAVAAAALCIGGFSSCSREIAAPPPTASSEDSQNGAPLETGRTPSRAELDERLDAYLGAEKQVYGDETRSYLDTRRSDLSIPVPPIEPMEKEVPALLPLEPAAPEERP